MRNSNIRAIILAAGQGKRLMPHTKDTPKCLIKINGLPILYYQLIALEKCNITKITIVVGFQEFKIKKYINQTFPNLNISFVSNTLYASTNTLYSLALAAESLSFYSTIIQINGDVIFDHKLLGLLLNSGKKSVAAVQYKPCGTEEIKFLLRDNGSIININKKINPVRALGEAIGINKFTSEFWTLFTNEVKSMKEEFKNEYYEFAIEHLVTSGKAVLWPLDVTNHNTIEIDFIEDIIHAKKIINTNNLK